MKLNLLLCMSVLFSLQIAYGFGDDVKKDEKKIQQQQEKIDKDKEVLRKDQEKLEKLKAKSGNDIYKEEEKVLNSTQY